MASTLRDMIQMLFEVETAARQSQVAVSNVNVTRVAGNNPNRLSLILSNPGVNGVYVSFERDFVSGEGLLLVPSGGFVSYMWDEDFDVVGWGLYGIALIAPVNINVLEIVSI